MVRYDNTSTQSGYTLIDNPNVNQSFVSNRFYTVAVVARGINFEMYVDHQMINTAFDTRGCIPARRSAGYLTHVLEHAVKNAVTF